MNKQEIREFELALLEFVKRASAKGATADEVESLPAVAEALTKLLQSFCA